MKTKLINFFAIIPFFALLIFTSCQEEEIDVVAPDETEALTATSELTSFLSATSSLDGSEDNIIDRASCVSVNLPVTVNVRGTELLIETRQDYARIQRLYDEFEDDIDRLDIIFPITITNTAHEEFTIASAQELANFIVECEGRDNEDVEIKCIDFQYPIAFSIFDTNAEIINTVTVENDRALNRFIRRVRNAEVVANLDFPVTMVLTDGTMLTAENNEELRRIIFNARRTCEVANDFTRVRLENYLKRCPWLVFEFERDNENNTERYVDYALNFQNENVVKLRAREGDVLTGTWELRRTRRGVLLNMEFENLADFTLEWLIYDFEDGKIKIHEVEGNRILLNRNCDVVIDITKARVENFLQECFWRVARLNVNGTDNEADFIGTPLNFLENNVVRLRVDGELIAGIYNVIVRERGIGLEIDLEDRPNLRLRWLITFLGNDSIRLVNENNQMLLTRHCLDNDTDVNRVEGVLTTGEWEIASYITREGNQTAQFGAHAITYGVRGRLAVTRGDASIIGSWFAYRGEGLNLGMRLRGDTVFSTLNFRWKIAEITPNRIELRDFNTEGIAERTLVLEKL